MMINYDTMISFDDSFDDSCITSQESSSTVSSPYNNNLGKLFTNNNDISSSTSSSTTTTPTKSFIYTRSEEISIDENRFALTRQWNVTLPHLLYIMLNPSSATDKKNDPTMRRCIDFANDNGYGTMHVLNLYPLRCTSPKNLNYKDIPIKDMNLNDNYIESYMKDDNVTAICLAWGSIETKCQIRALEVLSKLHDIINNILDKKVLILSLGLTIEGYPRHPLYVKKYQKFINYLYKKEDILLIQEKRKLLDLEKKLEKKRNTKKILINIQTNDIITKWGILNIQVINNEN